MSLRNVSLEASDMTFRLYLLAGITLCTSMTIVPSHAAAEASCSLVNSAVRIASELRGLPIVKKVPCKLQDRSQVEAYLRDTISKKIPREKLENEGLVSKAIGLIPWEFSYVDGLIALYTDQLGGYYDPDGKFYAMAAWMPESMQMPIAVHELTHALQDQHFNLDDIVNDRDAESDVMMARSALIEGDATAVMFDYSRMLAGQGSIAKENSVSELLMSNILGATISGMSSNAPKSLHSLLIFPYVSGLNFAHVLLKESGYKRINEAFKRLPTSTEEVLHPEKYLSGKKDYEDVGTLLPPPGFPKPDAKAVYSDRIGEFAISTLLGVWTSGPAVQKAAAGWGGDRISLFKDGNRRALTWETRWDTAADAQEFFSSLDSAYRQRFAPAKADDPQGSPLAAQSGDRRLYTDAAQGFTCTIAIDSKKVVVWYELSDAERAGH